MTEPAITALIVGGGAALTLVLNIVRDRGKARAAREREQALAEKLRIQHEWDMLDRKNHTQAVLGAIQEGTQAAASAYEVGNNVNQKLLAMDQRLLRALPTSDSILSSMLKSNTAVSPADMAHVLIELRTNFNALEKYSHDSVHRINGLIAQMQAKTALSELEKEG